MKRNVGLALVAGATSGIGKAISERLQSEGLKVIEVSRSTPQYSCNVCDENSCKKVVQDICKEHGSINILVNAAGINVNKLLIQTSTQDFTNVLMTNVVGSMNMSRACLRYGGMIQQRSGCITNIGSVVGIYGNAGQVAYSASKAALIGASLSLSKEYGSHNIRCNVVCPGLIEGTGMFSQLSDVQKQAFLNTVSLRRFGSPNEVADAVAFLCFNSFMNGHVLTIDGGRS